MEDSEFEALVEKAIESLPQEFAEKLDNVSVMVADWPTLNQRTKLVKRGEGNILLGLYEGIPQTRRGQYGLGGALPDRITIFKIPLLTISKDIDKLKENIKDTVIHEIGHHFGLSDADIERVKSKK